MTDLAEYDPIGLFAETEGLTAILPVERARELGLAEAEWFRRITLTVHSSLEAVGLTASISAALAAEGISANVVAAYFHDHVLCPKSAPMMPWQHCANSPETSDSAFPGWPNFGLGGEFGGFSLAISGLPSHS